MSHLSSAMRQIPPEDLEQEIRILKSHAVVDTPTPRSVCLERNLNAEALMYLKQHCGYNTDGSLAEIVQANAILID